MCSSNQQQLASQKLSGYTEQNVGKKWREQNAGKGYYRYQIIQRKKGKLTTKEQRILSGWQ